MKIAGVTVCFNESKMVKYVMPYWERIGIDKLIVYDNMSTDNTVELLKQYPFVEVRTFDTGGKFNDPMNSKLKKDTAQELRDAGYDWIYHGDFDEVIYCPNPNFREELQKIEDLGGSIFCRDLVHPFTPIYTDIEFDPTKLIHEQRSHFVTWYDWTGKWGGSKVLMHSSKKIHKISFSDGCHNSSFDQNGNEPVVFGYPFIAFHLKFVDFPVLEKNSHAKNERILYRLDSPTCSNVNANYIKSLYRRTIGDDKIITMIDKLQRRCEKANTTNWQDFIERYDSDMYIVNNNKLAKCPNVSRLDYKHIDTNIFYK